ncbi:UNVERIFIED_CONTAM: hypothetical protein Sradi_2915300 [Sesamum radiatum]|uniref:RNase H type-1 domain-containing protein n=1 Tax=Sesamum radiatum TaxID=300843 RepID=A0AAW2RY92_SESRA
MVKTTVELSEFSIEFHSRPTIRAQVLVDFIVEMTFDNANICTPIWSLYVNESFSSISSGKIFLDSPQEDKLEYVMKLEFPTSNEEVEYEAFSAGERLALATGAKKIVIYSDLRLAVNHVEGLYEARGEDMAKYLLKAKSLLEN